jgi:L-fuculose-phosphate aldolase
MAIFKRNGTDRRSAKGRRLSLPNAHGKGVKLALFGRLLHQRGYVSGTDGNLSMRVGLDTVLVTPSGVSKGFMRSGDMVLVSLDGEKLAGCREPSSEVGLHLKIYKSRPDITAVVHAHPCVSTGFASAGTGLVEPICSELVLTLREIPLAPYALPGSDELLEAMEPFIHDHNAILMQNHGVVTYGETLERAYMNMETVEHCARIALVTKLLGQARTLSDYEVKQLLYSTSHKCGKS